MEKQEIKANLETNLAELHSSYDNIRAMYKKQKTEKDYLNQYNHELQEKRQEWTLMLAGLDKDQLKEYGSNESIRQAKFEQENINIIGNIEESQARYNNIQNEINEENSYLSELKHEKDILICLASLI